MFVTSSGISMLVRPLQSEKAELPIDMTLFGILMLVRPVHSLKAAKPIEVSS